MYNVNALDTEEVLWENAVSLTSRRWRIYGVAVIGKFLLRLLFDQIATVATRSSCRAATD
jgi:hypothetical protein